MMRDSFLLSASRRAINTIADDLFAQLLQKKGFSSETGFPHNSPSALPLVIVYSQNLYIFDYAWLMLDQDVNFFIGPLKYSKVMIFSEESPSR